MQLPILKHCQGQFTCYKAHMVTTRILDQICPWIVLETYYSCRHMQAQFKLGPVKGERALPHTHTVFPMWLGIQLPTLDVAPLTPLPSVKSLGMILVASLSMSHGSCQICIFSSAAGHTTGPLPLSLQPSYTIRLDY